MNPTNPPRHACGLTYERIDEILAMFPELEPMFWSVGDRIIFRGNEDDYRVIHERKPDNSGWWMKAHGGLWDKAAGEWSLSDAGVGR